MPTKLEIAREIIDLEALTPLDGTGVEHVEAMAVEMAKGRKPALEARLEAARNDKGTEPAAAEPEQPPAGQTEDSGTGDQPDPDETLGTDLAVVEDLPPAPAETLPDAAKWAQLTAMADYFGNAQLVPAALRGKAKTGDRALVLLAGHDLGITSTQAFQKIVVVDGKLSMMAELMAALILRDGHQVWPDPANNHEQATAWGRRWMGTEKGWSEAHSVTFTLDDAIVAGLCTRDPETKRARQRSSGGGIGAWEKYTPDLLWARALSRLARRTFPDCLAGVSYVPEELGYIDAEDAGPGHEDDQPTVSVAEQRSNIARRIHELPAGDIRDAFIDTWKRRNYGKVDNLRPAAVGAAMKLLDEAEAAAAAAEKAEHGQVADAELVCTVEGCEATAKPDGYCAEHAPPDEIRCDECTALVGHLHVSTCSRFGEGLYVNTPTTSIREADGEPSTGDICVGCSEPEHADDPFLTDDEGRIWHTSCAPFMGG